MWQTNICLKFSVTFIPRALSGVRVRGVPNAPRLSRIEQLVAQNYIYAITRVRLKFRR